MESAHDIMKRLGFNEEAENSTKAAFIKNLIKQAYGFDAKIPEALLPEDPSIEEGEQLCFKYIDAL